MELADDIRRDINNSGDRETIMEVVTRLQSNGIAITRDVLTAIQTTLEITEGVVE